MRSYPTQYNKVRLFYFIVVKIAIEFPVSNASNVCVYNLHRRRCETSVLV